MASDSAMPLVSRVPAANSGRSSTATSRVTTSQKAGSRPRRSDRSSDSVPCTQAARPSAVTAAT